MPQNENLKICLRDFNYSDFQEMAYWMSDPQTVRYLGSGFRKPWSYDMISDRLEYMMETGTAGGAFVIADGETEKYIGEAILSGMTDTAELSIVILPEYRKKGYGRAAVNRVLRYAFEEHAMHRVWVRVFAENTAAVNLFSQCGFQTEGTLREQEKINDTWYDTIIMGILKKEYEANKID